MTTYWCPRATLPEGVRKRVRLRVEEGRIVEVTPGVDFAPGDTVLDGLVRPGFANAHSHAFHRALRGRTHADGGTFWTWREHMYAVTAALDPLTYGALARAVFAEMVLAGYTVVGEFHYLHHGPDGVPYDDPNAMGEALLDAAEEAGIRITLLDTVYLAGGLFASGHQPLDDTQRRFSDGSVQAWRERVGRLEPRTTARHGAAIHSVRAVPREHLGEVAGFARAGLGQSDDDPAPLHIHLSEQPGENLACEHFYGMTPAALLAAEGVLSPDLTAVHATHLTTEDVELLGRAGTFACFCPTTERDLADGIGPARALHDAGVGLCIGSDQQAVVDPFEEVRAIELHERLVSLERGRFTLGELDRIGSETGYASLGWPEGGTLREGALADFISVRLDGRHTAGTDPEQVVFVAGNHDVSDVVVGGRHVVVGGRHILGPVGPLLRTAMSRVRP
ncbi:formimidoylglutamate deiminase [Nostocoides sp. F2B08]|uniref:formimidoylglutamate deiminase n=1 Tax=Nostocoides sp. F2B08 TaxID=2653936 RepID=UPI0012639EB7|nr:formimidoylglutamate deiminase [Tetrasphaera sp. F2B08]KAB7745227.1 formimidoylglutamate deiminase [Tetrasphaera sp. F2B08]